MQEAAGEVAIAEEEGDKAGSKVQAQVEKEDDDFDPDNAEADEGEPIGADEADDAGESLPVCVSCRSSGALAACKNGPTL